MTNGRTLPILLFTALVFALSAAAWPSVGRAATPAEEQAFLDRYQRAFESKDEKTLRSFLYTQGADPAALAFYETMQTHGIGGRVTRIQLLDLGPDDVAKARETQDAPAGKVRLPFAPTKKLVLDVSQAGPDGSSTSTSECFVGEVAGKLVVLVPVPAK